jgi:hypothetical protein
VQARWGLMVGAKAADLRHMRLSRTLHSLCSLTSAGSGRSGSRKLTCASLPGQEPSRADT